MIDFIPTVRIAAVITTYNRKELLEECIQSLLQQTRSLDGILIIDNASTDGSEVMVRAKFPSKATYIRLAQNTGSAGGFREGIRLAYEKGYDWVWCMDDDAEPDAAALEALVCSSSFHDPQVGILSSVVVVPDSKMYGFHHKRVTAFCRQVAVSEQDLQRKDTLALEATGWVGPLIRRSAIKAAGLPRKELFMFYCDTEYTYRISRIFKIHLIRGSKILHKRQDLRIEKWFFGRNGSVRSALDPPWRLYYAVRNRFFFVANYSTGWAKPMAVAALAVRLISGTLIFDDSKLKRIKLILKAARDGVLGKLGIARELTAG